MPAGAPPPPPRVEPGTPRIVGPDRVTVRVDAEGRFLLGRVAVICPAKPRLTCRVVVAQVAGRRVRILPLDFTIPAGRVSRIRLRLTPASRARLRRRQDARAAVQILAQQVPAGVVRRAAAMGVLRLRLAVASPRAPFAPRSRDVVAARAGAPGPCG